MDEVAVAPKGTAADTLDLHGFDACVVVPPSDPNMLRGVGGDDVTGYRLGPCVADRVVYADTAVNVDQYKLERIEKKQVKPQFTTADRQHFGAYTRRMITDVFTKRRIMEWIDKYPTLHEMKSAKWSEERMAKAIEELWGNVDNLYEFKAKIKAEPSNPDKPPRGLIADGDLGQVMALASVKCLEDIMFSEENFEQMSIKHLGKREAMQRVSERLRDPRHDRHIIEGDGSAWDTTMSADLRAMVENPILVHISSVLVESGIIPQQWADAHLTANSKKKLRLAVRMKLWYKKKGYVIIDAIRRSGHRGTSCLNFLENHALWSVVLFAGNAHNWVNSKCRSQPDRWGHTCHKKDSMEGDDSILSTSEDYSERRVEIEGIFKRFGINMKLKFPKVAAEFTGWLIRVDRHGTVPGEMMPDLPRALASSSISVSRDIVDAAKAGDMTRVAAMAASVYVSRAHDFSGFAPTVSNLFMKLAESWSDKPIMDHEMKMRTMKVDIKDILSEIWANNAASSVNEAGRLSGLGWNTSASELASVAGGAFTHFDSDEGFTRALPASWR